MTHSIPNQSAKQNIPYGYCQCGCGQLAPIAKRICKAKGQTVGQPLCYVHGHNQRQYIVPSAPQLCLCGCGKATPIAKQTDSKFGYTKGQPIRYIAGHQARKYLPAPDGYSACTKCGEIKPATGEYFSLAKTCKDGLRGVCKICRALSTREYLATNKEKIKANAFRRRARKAAARGTHTAADIKRQYKAQKGKCYYCDVKVGKTYHVDHVVPLSRGGSNGPENLVVACAYCNASKHDKLPHEWFKGGRLL